MANIKLRENMFGGGYSGSVDVRAGLSWMDSAAIRTTARAAESTALAARETAFETQRARVAIEKLGYGVDQALDAVASLESSIGLKLDEQTRVLERQSDVLSEIRDAVVNPNRTRAAERVADADQLLRSDRFERALKVANEGIDADPNNPQTFFSAGWALVGLERFDEAREMFVEARDSSTGDQRSLGARQAARSAFLGGNSALAYELIRDARATAVSNEEKAAVAYDVAVYAAVEGDSESVVPALQEAFKVDSRHADRALLDPAFDNHEDVHAASAVFLEDMGGRIESERTAVITRAEELKQSLPDPPQDRRAHTEFDPGVRPDNDPTLLRTRINQGLTQARDAAKATAGETPLQGSLEVIQRSTHQVEGLARNEIPLLTAAIGEHETAASTQDELEARHRALTAEREKWTSAKQRLAWPADRAARLVGWGVAFSLVGLLVTPLLVLGVVMVIAAIVGGIGTNVSDSKIRGLDAKLDEVDRDLLGSGGP